MEERKILMDFTNKSGKKDSMLDDGKLDLARADADQSQMQGDDTFSNWCEVRFPELGPHRRGYHSSFIHNNK